jgi:DNA-binding CsgD family transcriptional regulator
MDAGAPNGGSFFPHLHALIERGDPRFEFVAPVGDAIEALTVFAATASSSMWNMQRHSTIHNLVEGADLDQRDRRHGLDLRFILPRRVAEVRNPMVSSYYDYLRLAPVAHPMMMRDRARVLLGDSTGEGIWISRDPEVVAAAVRFFEGLWHAAEPAVPPGQDPPFTPRMVQIAIRLVNGATDREIARDLGVSERTVSSDVREMSKRLGARSRAHAIALVSGVYG